VCWGIMILCDGKRLKFKLLTDEAFLFKFMAWEATPTRVMVGMRIGYPYICYLTRTCQISGAGK
jgi:hypothetical protein